MEETNVENTQQAAPQQQRPTLLIILCILTWIGRGLAVIFGIIGLVAAGVLDSMLSDIPGFSSMVGTGDQMLNSIVNLIVSAAAFWGAIMMWQLKKLGFWIYAGANVVGLFFGFGWIALIITALFIFLYYLNLKHME